ncbi:MAG: dihydroorotate dehydrogenase electron transfer subunit [Thermodesulfovibrionales bacterium]
MNRYFRAEIAENRQLNKDYNLLTFIPPGNSKEPEPGQFYMIGRCVGEVPCKNAYDPFLKRPFSIFRKTAWGYQILYRIRGMGTLTLKEAGKGAMLDVIGPLGNPYPISENDRIPLIVAGGIGIASLFFLAERLAGKPHIFYGARTEDEIFFISELRKYAKELFISTDDGSMGEKGTIIEVLDNFLSRHSITRHLIYACGPRQMLEAISQIAKNRGVTAYISMEENMACGIGACLGCAVKTAGGYKRVCKEGPVFDVNEIVW